jgi:hypothetical protein
MAPEIPGSIYFRNRAAIEGGNRMDRPKGASASEGADVAAGIV